MSAGVELVERERELGLIDALLTNALTGRSGALLFEGPAGIGKTSLVTAAVKARPVGRMRVLRARGGELERDVSFAVVRELFLPALTGAAPSFPEEALADAARLALPALGMAPTAPDAVSPEGRFAAVYGLYWLTMNLAAERPLFLVIDDAHLADDDSLRWLGYLLGRLDEQPIALLLAARPTDRAVLRAAVGTHASAVTLAPLSAQAVAEMIGSSAHGSERVEAFARAVHEATGGVPFLVRAVLDAVADGRVTPGPAAAGEVATLAAAAAGHASLVRLAALGDDAMPIAEAVAVLGRAAHHRHVVEVSGQPAARVASLADALAAAGFLKPGWPLEFAHPLVEESVYSAIPAGRRSQLHSRAAEVLALDPDGADQAAAHLLSTEPAGEPRRVALLVGAADRAVASGAPSAAVAYLRRALQEPPSPGDVARMLLDLGLAELQSGDPVALDHLGQAAELAQGGIERAHALRALSLALLGHGRVADVLTTDQAALDSLGSADRELELEIRGEMLAVAQMSGVDRTRFDQLAAGLDAELLNGATRGERRVLGALAFDAMRSAQPVARTIALAHRALDGWDPAGHGDWGSPAMYLARLALVYAGDPRPAEELTDRILEQAIAHGAPLLHAQNLILKIESSFRAGDLPELQALAATMMEAAQETVSAPWVVSLVVPHLAVVHVERMALPAARALLAQSGLMDLPAREIPFDVGILARGTLRLAEGDPRGALDDLLACGERVTWGGSVNPAALPWRSRAAMACAELADRAKALALAGEELAIARQFGAPGPIGAALATHGTLVGGEDGIAELHEAVELLGRSPARLEHARAVVRLGAAQRRAGQRRAARDSLRAGLELATRCQADGLMHLAENELKASGARLVKRPISGLEALTPSEHRVAVLAADGHTNAQIAQSLFLSLKTVETHLGRTYRKLGITSRAELTNRLTAAASEPTGFGSAP